MKLRTAATALDQIDDAGRRSGCGCATSSADHLRVQVEGRRVDSVPAELRGRVLLFARRRYRTHEDRRRRRRSLLHSAKAAGRLASRQLLPSTTDVRWSGILFIFLYYFHNF